MKQSFLDSKALKYFHRAVPSLDDWSFQSLWRRYGINPLDRLLDVQKKKGARKILIVWNRGMGDVPLGLYGLNQRIRQSIPDAQITYLTRVDLKEGFDLLEGIDVLSHPEWKRYQPVDIDHALTHFGLNRGDFDWVLEKPDPTSWLLKQRGVLIPRLQWDPQWNESADKFVIGDDKPCLGVHIQTETFYTSFDRNWPLSHWTALFQAVVQQGYRVLLFGFRPDPIIEMADVIDLRGKTTLREMLALIRRHCTRLVLPDSGPLAMNYYLDVSYPIRIVSLWADPRHGVLKQAAPSPNPQLEHIPLLSPKLRDLSALPVEWVLGALNGV